MFCRCVSFVTIKSRTLLSGDTKFRAILLLVMEVELAATEAAAAAENPVLFPKHLIAEQSKVHHRHEFVVVRFGIKFDR